MSIRLFDPCGAVQREAPATPRGLAALDGAPVGYVFNLHPSALTYWQRLEEAVGRALRPAGAHRIDKPNVSTATPPEDLRRLVEKTAYAVIGVGA